MGQQQPSTLAVSSENPPDHFHQPPVEVEAAAWPAVPPKLLRSADNGQTCDLQDGPITETRRGRRAASNWQGLPLSCIALPVLMEKLQKHSHLII